MRLFQPLSDGSPRALTHVADEAADRSPTLLAGMTPGAQGVVRLWAPRRVRLWLRSLVWGAPSVVLVFLFFNHLNIPLAPLAALCGMFAAVCLSGVAVALGWPRHLAADDAGFAIETWGGGYTLQWNQVQAVERRCTAFCQPYLAVHTAEKTFLVEFSGYPRDIQEDIIETIVERSGLSPNPHSPLVWVRPLELAAGKCPVSD